MSNLPAGFLNLNNAAWRRLAEDGYLPREMALWGQRYVAARYFSMLERFQRAIVGKDAPIRDDPILILGYWRSGTTLLHEYLALDRNMRAPTTHACMNPHHFVFTQASARNSSVRRPMDSVVVSALSPGEEDFALLALGASSPYGALLFPERLKHALLTADPADVGVRQQAEWLAIFRRFLQAVHYVEGPYRLVLKSPAQGFRMQGLMRLFPNARYVLMVRDPMTLFESVVRMWRSLARHYAFSPVPSEDTFREIVLMDRQRFEDKLWSGLQAVPQTRRTLVRYEDLMRDPKGTLKQLYDALGLEGLEDASPAFGVKAVAVANYRPAATLPDGQWKARVNDAWHQIAQKYGYASVL